MVTSKISEKRKVIASKAKQSPVFNSYKIGCFVVSLLAMTKELKFKSFLLKNLVINILIFFIIINSASAQNHLSKANDYYMNNEYDKAIQTYYKALKNGENPTLAYFNLGNTYYQLDSISKAIVCYQSSITEAPEFFRAYLNLGILYYNLSDMGSAIAVLKQAQNLEPENMQVMLTLATAYTNVQDYSLAIPCLEKVIERNPKADDCYFLLFEINSKIGDPEGAKKWLDKYPDTGKRAADKYQLLGEMAEEDGNLSQAIYYYNRIISIAPKRKWTYFNLVRSMQANGNTLSALQQADMALASFENFSDLALLAGNIAFEAKYYKKAERFYTSAYNAGNAGGLVGLQNLIQVYKSHGEEENEATINAIRPSVSPVTAPSSSNSFPVNFSRIGWSKPLLVPILSNLPYASYMEASTQSPFSSIVARVEPR